MVNIGTTLVSPITAGSFSDYFDKINADISSVLNWAYDASIVWVLIVLLLATGIYFTIRSRFMQVRLFGHMFKVITDSRSGAKGGISSFQAFAIGLADRVGTGSIAGVALAVVAGGPGAVFWMWIVALVGMVTAFVEATLAQIFKVRNGDGTFRGGPAFYILRGLNSRKWGAVFAILLIFAYGFSFEMIQSNSISQLAEVSFGAPTWVTAVILTIMTLPLVLGGMRKIAVMSEYLAPIMALVYVVMGLLVMAINFHNIPHVFSEIFAGAFGGGTYVPPAVAGATGAFIAALTTGIKRGLFTNEAGMGSAPNAAATATVDHPVTQGMIQALGVFVDTMLVCTSTAFIILMSGPFWNPNRSAKQDGTALTSLSLVETLGSSPTTHTIVSVIVLVLMICFGYTTILGNFTYAETNYRYLAGLNKSVLPLKLLVIFSTFLGAVLPLPSVWSIADWATALMTIVNLGAILLLGKWAFGALRDYEAQRSKGETPIFCSVNNPHLPGELPTDVWDVPGGHHESWNEENATNQTEKVDAEK
ncbi:alanine/glycine:cation symporter family protein [Actinotignum urinale]|uniref:alanine/glycine:cation symporter family protein n=1 Tax=Actinotignum urinale TaxID=190146 RepID=UPI00370D6DE9